MGVSTAFKAMETEKGDDKNSIQRKETKNNTLKDAAECREYPQLQQSFLQGKQAFVLEGAKDHLSLPQACQNVHPRVLCYLGPRR